jgi:hypothetical protein
LLLGFLLKSSGKIQAKTLVIIRIPIGIEKFTKKKITEKKTIEKLCVSQCDRVGSQFLIGPLPVQVASKALWQAPEQSRVSGAAKRSVLPECFEELHG